ncbi:serine hydrolase [Roseomonas terrae]|jgi:CubicO group peptidase (beta-lactamase class C family)|uniref:Serine hydrolase n=1 Tax=Neoroseomonas terrae TaxID=424799 RepID=A0ABS5EM99_9PROT|nr:serine hydrolase [Neoroseomonas terrae]MBR0652153.1 serine hydrolase [Neoroseomonas terrae]
MSITTTDVFPAASWEEADPGSAGLDAAALDRFTERLRGLTTTSFMIVAGGRSIYRYGDVSEASYLASTRKSILSLLYGPHVASGTIDLSLTLEQLGIDDVKGLLPAERRATIRDILTSRSGVYYPAGSPGGDDAGTPERGAHAPGTRFHYNNWDFNVAGAIFEQLTGIAVHDALRDQLAVPLGFEDFDRDRQRMLGYPDRSRFLAYHMFLSGRDMARVGLLALRGGRWNGRQIVPEAWVHESTMPHVTPAGMHGTFAGRAMGYGYYWWVPMQSEAPEWRGAFLASGHYGQFILGLPALDLVMVHRRAISDERAMKRNAGVDLGDLPSVSGSDMVKLGQVVLDARV